MKTEQEILEEAIATFGEENQMKKLLEEMAELQKEICKHWFGEENLKHIAEETADLEIMLTQLKMILDIRELVTVQRGQKVDRLSRELERIKEQKH